MGKYDDILHCSRPVSAKHPPMPLADRAAQFSPFAALTGYDAAVRETERLTEPQREPDEETLAFLNGRLRCLAEHESEHPEVTVTYFRPDETKSGGAYICTTGRLQRIDEYERTVCLSDGRRIRMEQIAVLRSPLFRD